MTRRRALERYRAERRQQGAAAPPSADNVVAMPRRERERRRRARCRGRRSADAEERIKDYPGVDADVRSGLLDIARIDPGLRSRDVHPRRPQAYEMIVTAFAEGNRKLLKDLLEPRRLRRLRRAPSPSARRRGEQVDQSFVGINKADIVESELKSGIANVTVRFVSQLISATRDKAGAIISGDPQKIKEVTDIWTFSRDVSTAKARANPNWRLIATQSPA